MSAETTKHIIQVVVLLVLFVATVVEKNNAKAGRATRERLYWGLMTVALIVGIGNEAWQSIEDARRSQIRGAAETVASARLKFNNGVEKKNFGLIEDALGDLQIAGIKLASYTDDEDALPVLLQAWNDIAVGQERLAYGEASSGCRYWLEVNSLKSCRAARGSSISLTIPRYKKEGVVRCTDLSKPAWWVKARESYKQLHLLITNQSNETNTLERLGELTSASRNVGYFHLCDYLRFEQHDVNALTKASDMWTRAEKLSRGVMETRNAEIQRTIAVLNVFQVGSNEDFSELCVDPCDESMD